jgi:PIN domain nuclease of toxin-antitoxin system
VILLLDAHALLWAVVEPSELPAATREAIESPANDVVASVASIWKLEIKRAIDRLRFDVDLVAELERVGLDILPITAADAVAAARLPLHHRDPFDRMLVAQATRLDAVVVTRDRAFDRYGVETLAA